MSARPVALRNIAVSAVVVILAGLGSARAAEPPDKIAEVIADAAQACRAVNGKPDTGAILRTDDLNGDGGKDWIADFALLKCDGGANPVCGNAGCTLQLYFWDGDDTWDLVFEDFVQSYKFSTSGGTRTMHVTTSGLPCNKPAAETCTYTYRLEKDAVVPVQ